MALQVVEEKQTTRVNAQQETVSILTTTLKAPSLDSMMYVEDLYGQFYSYLTRLYHELKANCFPNDQVRLCIESKDLIQRSLFKNIIDLKLYDFADLFDLFFVNSRDMTLLKNQLLDPSLTFILIKETPYIKPEDPIRWGD